MHVADERVGLVEVVREAGLFGERDKVAHAEGVGPQVATLHTRVTSHALQIVVCVCVRVWLKLKLAAKINF